ncbi:Cytochrome P450 [Bosea sp. LC85]|uniref:cytochrome P450 n=1 Tax=Bosea sp. LC85 TaxID=1502851 RepID=UPI0004E41B01|nr:cytochrome P450 [Bosea sp. LC85]KFC65018.1 Cytochrome P450 [Bosea sp. LC85]
MALSEVIAERRKRRTPPAPIPSDREFGRLELLLRLRRNPLTLWREQHFQDPIVAGKSVLGYGVVISDPAAIRHVLVENGANYQKDALQRAILAPGLGEGLLTVEGDAWKRARRTLAPLFTPRRVEALAKRMLPPIAGQVARMAQRRPGRIVDISQDMTRLTYDVLAETLFSNAIAGGATAFGRALTHYFATQGKIDPLDVLGAPAWIPRIGRLRARSAIDFFARQIDAIVTDRQALRMSRPAIADPDGRDLLDALLDARDPETGTGLSEAEVGANIVTFIGAGHETTANALTWSLYLVAMTPDVRERLEAEADTVAADPVAAALAGDRLTMTRAVIEEAMRLYPPVPSLSRAALAEDHAGGVAIPKGALVIISPYVLHRHRTLWTAPRQFWPERFLPGERETIDRYAYLPFGAGPRVCIGQQFAMTEAVLGLTMLIGAFRFDYAGRDPPVPMQQITLRPQGGMPMKVRARR